MNVVIGVLYVFLVYNSMFGFGFVELKMVLLVNDIVILIIFGMVQFQKFFNLVMFFNFDLILKFVLGVGFGLWFVILSGLGLIVLVILVGVSQVGLVGGMLVLLSWVVVILVIWMVVVVFLSIGFQVVLVVVISEGSLFSQMVLVSVVGGVFGGVVVCVIGGFFGGG